MQQAAVLQALHSAQAQASRPSAPVAMTAKQDRVCETLDALRADSVLFERAYTHIGLTLPSHGSVLSGLLPIDHGVRDNVGYRFAEELPA